MLFLCYEFEILSLDNNRNVDLLIVNVRNIATFIDLVVSEKIRYLYLKYIDGIESSI